MTLNSFARLLHHHQTLAPGKSWAPCCPVMKILFDSQIFQLQRVGGVSRYIVELAQELNQMDRADAIIVAPLHLNELLNASRIDYFGIFFPPNVALRPGLHRRLGEAASVLFESLRRYDVLHVTYYFRHRKSRSGRPLVVTVHDMIHERFPQMFSPHDATRQLKNLRLRLLIMLFACPKLPGRIC